MLEGYITPLLTSYLNKYIKNLKPSDLQVSFWGGDAILRNLELRLDAIEEALRGIVPFQLKSGSVKQLTVHIPWTSIGSEPIVLTLDSVECTIKLSDLLKSTLSSSTDNTKSNKTPSNVSTEPDQQQSQTPGYIGGLLNRISNNIVLKVTNLLLKIIEDRSDMLFSISFKEIEFFTANELWKKQFVYTDHFESNYLLCKVCLVTGATICLDVISNSGQVEFYDEPFVPNCNFECRWKASYRDNIIIENRFEMLFNELVTFSVSGQQFSLFLHFVDWLISLYYSMKKLKGRDDIITEKQTNNTIQQEELTDLSVTTKSTEADQEGSWGNWFMSFIDDTNSGASPLPVIPTTPPSLSLGFYAKHVVVNFKVTQKKPHPVFFSTVRNTSWNVMSIEFLGCSARVDRIPLTKQLSVSIGIMSINGWIGGACPCQAVAMMTTKRHQSGSINSQLIHVYTVGDVHDSVDLNSLLNGSFFDGSSVDVAPTSDYWLQYKTEYSAVWFSYDYHDIDEEHKIETCFEKLVFGQHRLILTTDVLHRLEFYIKKNFLASLEATPLLSQGLTVIGDPQAKTNFSITSGSVHVSCSTNTHIFNQSHDLIKSDSLPSVLVTFEGANVDITMAMYSGNATPQHPQTLLIEGTVEKLRIVECSWNINDQVNALLKDNGKISSNANTLKFNIHNHNKDTIDGSQCYQLIVPELNITVDMSQLYFIASVFISWFIKTDISFPPISVLSNDTVDISLTNITIKYSLVNDERTFSASLGKAFASISSSCVAVSFFESPAPVQTYTTLDQLPTVSTSNERAFEIYTVSYTKGDAPSIRLIIGNTSLHLCYTLLKYIEGCTSNLSMIWSHISSKATDTEIYKDLLIDEKKYSLEEDKDEFNLQETIISIMQAYNTSVFAGHLLIAFSPTVATPTENMATPIFLLKDVSKQRDVLVAVFPQLRVESTNSHAHPILSGTSDKSSDLLSWKLSLTHFSLYTVIGCKASYMLHPLSIDVSMAPIQTVSGGINGLGIHIDIELLQCMVAKQQVLLFKDLLTKFQKVYDCFVSDSVSPSVEEVVLSQQSLSLPSSPHLSLTSLPRPPSDTSTSISSSPIAPAPSLWLQLTLSKLVVDVVSDGTTYLTEAEEILFSFDKQEKGSSCQLKVSSLEMSFDQTNLFVTKLFSSRATVASEAAAKNIEACLGSTHSTRQVVMPPVSKFILLEVMTFSSDHYATDIKLQVQTFEAVVWLPLVSAVVDILSIIPGGNNSETEKHDIFIWPNLEVKLCGFQVYVPFHTSTLLINNEGVVLSSHLNFPVSRMIINSSAMRKLNIAVSDKRMPPLPGYQFLCYSLQIIGIRNLNDSYTAHSITTATDFKILYSPPLYCSSKSSDKFSVNVPATGHLIEVHVDNETYLYCGHHQIFCIANAVVCIAGGLNSFLKKQKQTPGTKTTVQLLFTGKSVNISVISDISYCTDQFPLSNHTEGIHLTVHNPMLMVTITEDVSKIDLSIFNLNANYLEDKLKCNFNLVETAHGSVSNDTGLPVGLLVFKYQKHVKEGYTVTVELNRSVHFSISTALIQLIIKLVHSFNDAVTSIHSVINSIFQSSAVNNSDYPPMETSVIKEEQLLLKFKCLITTKQVVCRIQSNPVLEPEISKGSGQIALFLEKLNVNVPSTHELLRHKSHDYLINGHIFVEGLQFSVIQADNTIDIVPYTLLDCCLYYDIPRSKYESGRVLLTLIGNEICVVVQLNAIQTVICLLNEYIDLMSLSMLRLKNSEADKNSIEELKTENKIHFYDDLRRGDLFASTEDIESLCLPNTGEIRFFCGSEEIGNKEPAYMAWCYREPRVITKVHILPVPLAITLEEDYPVDIKVACELSFYDDVNEVWKTVDTLYLSETAPAATKLTNIDCPATKWRLSLTALEWFDDEENYTHNIPLPLTDSHILSPLALAGCTCIDSILLKSFLSILSIDIHIRKLDTIIRHELSDSVISGQYNSLRIQSDLDNYQLDLFRLSAVDMNCVMHLYQEYNFIIQLAGSVSAAFLNMASLVWSTVLHSTQMNMHLGANPFKQRPNCTSLDVTVSSSPCIIRINPSLIFTTAMAMHIIQRHIISCCDNNKKDFIVAPYVICNYTSLDLYIKQCNTTEAISLPKKTCIGYTWRTLKIPQKILVCHAMGNCQSWSNELTLNSNDLQEVCLSTEPAVTFFVDTTLNGGVQKIVSIKGNLSIISQLSIPLILKLPLYTANQLQSYTQTGQFEDESTVVLASNEILENLFCLDKDVCTLMAKINASDSFTELTISNDIKFDLKQLKVNNFHCWLSSEIDRSSTSLSNIRIVFAPVFEVHNWLPHDVNLFIKKENTGESHIVLPSKGHTQSFNETLDVSPQYHISFACVSDSSLPIHCRSKPLKLCYTLFSEQFAIQCTDDWPYRNCSAKHIMGHNEYIEIPTDDNEVINAQLMFTRRKEGSLMIVISPQVLFVNETQSTVILERKNGHQLKLNSSGIVSLSFDETLKIIIQQDDVTMTCGNFTISVETTDVFKRLDLVTTVGTKKICKLLLHTTTHINYTIATLKPLFMFINSSAYPLSVISCLHNGTAIQNYTELTCIDNISTNEPTPLLMWYKMDGGVGPSPMYALYVTATANTNWSLPLSLNYVRRSFSLPLKHSGNISCVLTTHEESGIYWIVISVDCNPRFIVSNTSTYTMYIRECGTQGIHSHYETLSPGHETVFEPPSLAKLYPLIEEQEAIKDDDNKQAITFKTLSEISVEFRSSSGQEWSSPVVLSYDMEQYIETTETKFLFATSYQNGCLYGSLLPAHFKGVFTSNLAISNSTRDINLSVSCTLEQLAFAFGLKDDNDMSFISVVQVVFDQIHCSIHRCMNNGRSNIEVKSIQIDNLYDKYSKYPVVAVPRYDHKPPLKIVNSDLPPFLSLSFSWVLNKYQYFPEICVISQPVTIQIDDRFIQRVRELLQNYSVPYLIQQDIEECVHNPIPFVVLEEAERDSKGLTITLLTINSIDTYISAHINQTISVSCDDSHITLPSVHLTHVFSNWIELSKSLATHYTTSMLLQSGWLIGSVDLIGSPGLLLNNLHSGFRDFFCLPYEGITRGPGFFILGLGRGTTSLLSSISGGVLSSITNFASGIASNMEKLSLDSEHAKYQEMLRHRSQESSQVGANLVAGVSGLGMSMMSAVAGIVEQPMQKIHNTQAVGTSEYTKSMFKGIGIGLIGVMTKPVGGVFQLVSQAGQGIIDTIGLRNLPHQRELPILLQQPSNEQVQLHSLTKCIRILQGQICINDIGDVHTINKLLYITSGHLLHTTTNDCTFVLTNRSLLVLDNNRDILINNLPLINYECIQRSDGKGVNSLLLRNIQQESTYFHGSIEQELNYELTLNDDVYISTFISLFTRARRHQIIPQEFFV